MLRVKRLSAASAQFLAQQHGQAFLWLPVAFMPGIWLYFSLSFEPWAYSGALLTTMLAAAVYVWRTHFSRLFLQWLLVAVVGFTAAQIRTHAVSGPLLGEELFYKQVEGRITAMEPNEKKTRITLEELAIDGVEKAALPGKLRISVRDDAPVYHVGDRVRLKASLSPLPLPTQPGGYDFARHFYFMGIGGMGFSMSKVEIVEAANASESRLKILSWRREIATQFRELLPSPESEIAIAMAIGERGGIPQQTYDTLRDAGLVHLLSISGLHVSLVSGILFFSIRFLLSLWPYLALRVPVKKIAAILSLLGAYGYLALADFPLSAQRAFLMVAFVLLAILLDRRGISLRSIALAASCILLLFPEVLLGASFQLSFAATLAIICLYDRFGSALRKDNAHPMIKFLLMLTATMLTSFVASLATAPFVIYHFNRIAVLGIIANVAALPLTSFVIMPALVAAILLMPLGLTTWAIYPLREGLLALSAIADWAAHLPGASLQVPALSAAGVLFASIGLLMLCLLCGRIRLVGLPLWLVGMATPFLHTPAAIYVSDDVQQIMVRQPDGKYVTLKGTPRAFAVADWLQTEAQQDALVQKKSEIACEQNLCRFELAGKQIMVLTSTKDDAALELLCKQAPDLAIAPRFIKSARCPQPAMRLGRRETRQYGAHKMTVQGDKLIIETALKRPLERLWQPKRPEEIGALY